MNFKISSTVLIPSHFVGVFGRESGGNVYQPVIIEIRCDNTFCSRIISRVNVKNIKSAYTVFIFVKINLSGRLRSANNVEVVIQIEISQIKVKCLHYGIGNNNLRRKSVAFQIAIPSEFVVIFRDRNKVRKTVIIYISRFD